MITAKTNSVGLISILVGRYLPFLVGFTKEDVKRLYPYMEKNIYEMLRESGYLHIQATKPDTAGNVCMYIYAKILWIKRTLLIWSVYEYAMNQTSGLAL